jgi:hypothetical protein
MDKKLKTIENVIIEDTAKFWDNHEGKSINSNQVERQLNELNLNHSGSLSPSEARALRNRVADRLATAYSLEKMRKAIATLKESMELEKNLEKNLLHPLAVVNDDDDKKKKAKRVAVKKEKAEFDNNE